MNVLIYGGSFDPVHKGHYALLKAAIKQLNPHKIHLFTAYQSPFKEKPQTPFEVRLQMARAVLGPLSPNIIFDDFEQKAARVTYTWETVEYVRSLYPHAKIYLLVGTDCLNDIHRWKNAPYLFENSVITAGKRKGFNFETKDFNYLLLEGTFPLVSSTQLRLAILCNGLLPTNLPTAAAQMIEQNLMYGLKMHKWLQANLRPNRYLHVKLVAQAAVELARLYGANAEKLALAAILHDAAKCMGNKDLVQYALDNKLSVPDFEDICKYSPSLLHAEVSAHLAQKLFEIKDQEVLSAIKNHTLGSTDMGLAEKILFIADMASKDRRHKDAQRVHAASLKSLDDGMLAAMLVKLMFTVETSKWLAPAGIQLWNQIISKRK